MAILTNLPKDAEFLDLGAARAARAELRATEGKGNPFIKLTAGYIEVHAEFPLEAAFRFRNEDIKGALELILIDPADVDVLFAEGLSAQDLQAILMFLQGKSLGE